MPEGEGGAGQAPDAPLPQSPSGGQVPSAPVTPPAPTDPEPPAGGRPGLTLEQALDALANARKEAAAARVDKKRLAELEEATRKAEEAKLSETEKLQKRLSDLQLAQVEAQRKSQERVIRAEVRAQAAQVGVAPELAGRLIDYAEIEFDDEGEPKNIAKLLDNLVKQYPQLAPAKATSAASNGAPAAPQPMSVGQTPGNPARNAASNGAVAWSWEYINSLTAQQIAALSPERRQEMAMWAASNQGGRK